MRIIKTIWRRLRCKHDYRLLNIEWDGGMHVICAKCRKEKIVPLGDTP